MEVSHEICQNTKTNPEDYLIQTFMCYLSFPHKIQYCFHIFVEYISTFSATYACYYTTYKT
jgi:hypothetical protein